MSWYNENGPENSYVISSRARLARNLKGFRFPIAMSSDEAKKVIELVKDALEPVIANYNIVNLWETDENQIKILVEKHLISPAFKKGIRTAFVSKDENISIMVNEEDHIRIQCFAAGRDAEKALDMCKKIEKLLSEKLTFAYDGKYGYLTECPTNCGTALRISEMVHLPALVAGGHMPQILNECQRYGMTLRGVYGEESKASGAVYQISNQCSLGLDTDDILKRFNAMTRYIISLEENARTGLKENLSPELKDKILRSLGILKSSYMLSSEEFMELQSAVKLGMYLGEIKNDPALLTKLWVDTAPSSIGIADPTLRDIQRAQIVKERLKEYVI